jgi:hypothetical protein
MPGLGILPAESVRARATTATLKPVTVPTGATPDPGGIGRRPRRWSSFGGVI